MFNNKLSDDNITKLIDALKDNTRVHRMLLSKKEEQLPKVLYADGFAEALGIKTASLRCYMWQAKNGDKSNRKYLPSGYKGVRPYWLKEQVSKVLGMSILNVGDDSAQSVDNSPQKLMK